MSNSKIIFKKARQSGSSYIARRTKELIMEGWSLGNGIPCMSPFLKPCKTCHTVHVLFIQRGKQSRGFCQECGFTSVPKDSFSEAFDDWNRKKGSGCRS